MYAEIALVALELASGLETADDLIIDSADGGRIVVIEGADVDYPPPGWPIDL